MLLIIVQMHELDQLKRLVFELDYDPDGRKVVELEASLVIAAQAEILPHFNHCRLG